MTPCRNSNAAPIGPDAGRQILKKAKKTVDNFRIFDIIQGLSEMLL